MAEDEVAPIAGVDPETGELSEDERADLRAALRSDDPLERLHAARTCNQVVGASVDPVRPLVDDLAAVLDGERDNVAQEAGTALLGVAREHPEDLVDVAPALVSLARREPNGVRLLGANLLAALVRERPEAVAPDVHRLLPVLREPVGPYEQSEAARMIDDRQNRVALVEHEKEEHRMKLEAHGLLANVVVAAAEADPSGLFDHVDSLVDLLDHDDGSVAGAAVDALAEVARADADVAAPALEPLLECLEREDRRVRVRAVRALGELGDDRAVEGLRDLAASTDDEDVADVASETADFLDGE